MGEEYGVRHKVYLAGLEIQKRYRNSPLRLRIVCERRAHETSSKNSIPQDNLKSEKKRFVHGLKSESAGQVVEEHGGYSKARTKEA